MTGFEPQTFTTIAQEKPVIHHRAQGDERGGGGKKLNEKESSYRMEEGSKT